MMSVTVLRPVLVVFLLVVCLLATCLLAGLPSGGVTPLASSSIAYGSEAVDEGAKTMSMTSERAAAAAIAGMSMPAVLPAPVAIATGTQLLTAATAAASELTTQGPRPLPPGRVPKHEVAQAIGQLPRDVTAVLDDYIEQRGLHRKDVAARMGVSAGRVSQILSGDGNLTLKSVATICAALGVQMRVEIVDPALENENVNLEVLPTPRLTARPGPA